MAFACTESISKDRAYNFNKKFSASFRALQPVQVRALNIKPFGNGWLKSQIQAWTGGAQADILIEWYSPIGNDSPAILRVANEQDAITVFKKKLSEACVNQFQAMRLLPPPGKETVLSKAQMMSQAEFLAFTQVSLTSRHLAETWEMAFSLAIDKCRESCPKDLVSRVALLEQP